MKLLSIGCWNQESAIRNSESFLQKKLLMRFWSLGQNELENTCLLIYNSKVSISEVPAKNIPLICLFIWDSGDVGEKIAYLDSRNDHQYDLKFENVKIKLFQNLQLENQLRIWRENSFQLDGWSDHQCNQKLKEKQNQVLTKQCLENEFRDTREVGEKQLSWIAGIIISQKVHGKQSRLLGPKLFKLEK